MFPILEIVEKLSFKKTNQNINCLQESIFKYSHFTNASVVLNS